MTPCALVLPDIYESTGWCTGGVLLKYHDCHSNLQVPTTRHKTESHSSRLEISCGTFTLTCSKSKPACGFMLDILAREHVSSKPTCLSEVTTLNGKNRPPRVRLYLHDHIRGF